jgi:hypothetical protein
VEPIQGQEAARAGELASGAGPAADQSAAAAMTMAATTTLVTVARARRGGVSREGGMCPPDDLFRPFPEISGISGTT